MQTRHSHQFNFVVRKQSASAPTPRVQQTAVRHGCLLRMAARVTEAKAGACPPPHFQGNDHVTRVVIFLEQTRSRRAAQQLEPTETEGVCNRRCEESCAAAAGREPGLVSKASNSLIILSPTWLRHIPFFFVPGWGGKQRASLSVSPHISETEAYCLLAKTNVI